MRIRPVRGRALGGVLALAGVLALVPSVFWPTTSITQRVFAGPDETLQEDYVTLLWSWGRVGVDSAPAGADLTGMSNTWGLVFLVVVLVAGGAGAAAWLLVRGAHGRLLGVAGVAVAGSYAAHTVFRRFGERPWYGSDEFVVVGTPPSGHVEELAVGVLAAALAVMVWRSGLAVGRSAWDGVSAWAAAARTVDESPGHGTPDGERGRVIVHGERRVDGTVAPGHLAAGPAEPVGFTDPSADEDRFHPPTLG